MIEVLWIRSTRK